MRKYFLFLVFSILLLTAFPLLSQAEIKISISGYDFGSVKRGEIIKSNFKIKNGGDAELELDIKTSCECLSLNKSKFVITPGQVEEIVFKFDTSAYFGNVSNDLIFNSNDSTQPLIFIPVYGQVLSDDISDSQAVKIDENDNFDSLLNLYLYKDCKECIILTKKIREWIKKHELDSSMLTLHDLNKLENKEKLYEITKELGAFPEVPILSYDGKYYCGKKEISAFVDDREIKSQKAGDKLNIFFILLAGLLDGINPCAFTAIILLVSYMTLNLKAKKSILISGICYVIAVFVTYFLLGLGLFEVIKLFKYYSTVAFVLKYGLSIFLFILALFSLYDFYLSLKGKSKDMILKLPSFFQKSIRKNIRLQMKDYRIVFGAIFLGVTISLFELACTGQVYLPVLGYMARYEYKALGLVLLLVYNIGFILPLISIFLLVYKGVSSEAIGKFFSKNVFMVKLLFFILFVLFGILNIAL